MKNNKRSVTPTMKNSIDFFNFCTMDTRLPIYEIISERFVRMFRVSLSNTIRLISTITHSTQTMSFGDWVSKAENPSCMLIVRLNKLSGPALFKVSRPLAYGIVDAILGGSGEPFDLEGKEYTSLELSLMQDIFDLMLRDLEEAFEPVYPIGIEKLRTEINPQFVGIIPPSSKVVVTTFKTSFEKVEGEVELIMPYSTLFPMRNELFSSLE